MRQVLIHDPTLRDGQHAIRHQLGAIALRRYAEAADAARIPVVEVGHGNGLGASSLQVGQAAVSDDEMLSTVRQALRHGLRGPLPAPDVTARITAMVKAVDTVPVIFHGHNNLGMAVANAELSARQPIR